MKKRVKFNIRNWREAKAKSSAKRREVFKLMIGHPLTWLILMIGVVYTHAWCIS